MFLEVSELLNGVDVEDAVAVRLRTDAMCRA